MRQHLSDQAESVVADIPFGTLLYRFLFFDWLFVDMTLVKNPYERHAAWRHNQAMRRHLPTYFRRWSILTLLTFGLGCASHATLGEGLVTASFFTCFGIALTPIVVIAVAWFFLAKS